MNEFRNAVCGMLALLAWVGTWVALIVIIGMHLAGCTVMHGDTSLSFLQLAPGDDVQSRTTTLVGLEAAPLGVDGPQLRLGYIRSQQSRVPAYDAGTTVPAVSIKTSVDGKGIITETLEVDDTPVPKGWFH